MKISLIAPYSRGTLRGNIVTVERIRKALTEAGHEILLLGADVLSLDECIRTLTSFHPDVIHSFHAFLGASTGRALSHHFRIPHIITITGSDIYSEKYHSLPETCDAMATASAITCFDRSAYDRIISLFPSCSEKISIIPQGADKPADSGKRIIERNEHDLVILLPAAIRPEKDILFAINTVMSLQAEYPDIRLVIAGGIIDAQYAEEVAESLKYSSNATWLGEVRHDDMGALYRDADIVLNCSVFEGGLPNALLEAASAGKSLLLRDIPGNRSVLDFAAGWVFNFSQELRNLLVTICNDRSLLSKNTDKASMKIQTPRQEAGAFTELYLKLRG